MNLIIVNAVNEILELLDVLIPEQAENITNKLQILLQQIEKYPNEMEIVQEMRQILDQFEATKQWMDAKLNHLVEQAAFPNLGGNELKSLQVPSPQSTTDQATRLYPVWFGTDREPLDKNDLSKGFLNQRDNDLNDLTAVYYGQCQVIIPKSHEEGSLGRSRWRRWEWRTFSFIDDDHLKMAEIHPCTDQDDFWQTLKQQFLANDPDEQDALVFLHGYNSSFEDAALRAAQLGFDLKIKGVTGFFSWPSKNSPLHYPADETSIQSSEQAIADFLIGFATKSGAKRLHLIAHSMGNRGLLGALEKIMAKVNAKALDIKFGQIILAAPDLDVQLFRQTKAAYLELSKKTTLYTSSADIPVRLSQFIRGGATRLGIAPPIMIESGIDTIEIDNVKFFSLRHSYFAEASALLEDLHQLIHDGKAPKDRRRPQLEKQEQQIYWSIRI